MTNTEQLVLDEDGIPILTDIVHDDYEPEPPDMRLAMRAAQMAPHDIASELLGNESFRGQLEEVATTLTRNVCEQMEQALQPVLEQAISTALNDSDTISYETVRQQLESSLPDMVAEALQASDNSPD